MNQDSTSRAPAGHLGRHENPDRDQDPLLTARQATPLMPGQGGKPCHVSSVIRQIVDGHKLRDGSRLRLRAIRGSGGWLLRRSWLAEYWQAITDDRLGNPVRVPATDPDRVQAELAPRSPSERRAAADAAVARCEALGV